MNLVGRDPIAPVRPAESAIGRAAARFINDERDLPILRLLAVQTLTVIPTGVVLFFPGAFRWWLVGLHLVLVVYFIGPFVLMLHNTSHRKLFKRRYGWLNLYIPWVLGPFFGESPETYFAHHVGMHHPENNLEADLSSTMGYRRDSVVGFLRYFLRFFFAVLLELTRYLARKNRRGLMVRCLLGELSFFVAVGALLWVDWRAAVVVFVVPFVIARFAMMAGNWAQHAFIDRADPANCYRNSITCINSSYNRRCFNDGYHIGHHLKSTRHWSEMPGDFLDNVDTYAKQDAIVFRGLDFFGVWLFLMLGRYDWLANRVVALDGAPQSTDATIARLRSRTTWTQVS